MLPLLALAEVALPAAAAGAEAEAAQEDRGAGAADECYACLLCFFAADSSRIRSRFKLVIMVLLPSSTSFCLARSFL
jgi:hypothetical protein